MQFWAEPKCKGENVSMPSNFTAVPYEIHFGKCFGPMNTRPIDGGVGDAFYICQKASMIAKTLASLALSLSSVLYWN